MQSGVPSQSMDAYSSGSSSPCFARSSRSIKYGLPQRSRTTDRDCRRSLWGRRAESASMPCPDLTKSPQSCARLHPWYQCHKARADLKWASECRLFSSENPLFLLIVSSRDVFHSQFTHAFSFGQIEGDRSRARHCRVFGCCGAGSAPNAAPIAPYSAGWSSAGAHCTVPARCRQNL